LSKGNTKSVRFAVAAVGTGQSSGKDVVVEDRFYSPQEYRKLDSDQRRALHALREARGHVSNKANKSRKRGRSNPKKGGKSRKKPKSEVASIKSALKKMSRQISALATNNKDRDDADDDSVEGEANTNRNNPALTRQRGAPSRKKAKSDE
jgi:hypothetical protein